MTDLADMFDAEMGEGQGEAHAPERSLVARLVKRGDWLDGEVFAPLAWAVPGIVSEGLGLLAGPPKVGKSWAALDFALAVARGTCALGCIETGPARPVLFVALEDGDRRMQDRCRHLLDGGPIPASFHYATEEPHAALALIAEWLEQHGQERPLVVLDTLGKVSGPALPGESAYARDYRLGGRLKAITDAHPGVTLLAVHHVRKMAAEDFVDAVSGTSGLAGAVDFVMVLRRGRTETAGLLSITGRDVREAEYSLSLAGVGRWIIDGSGLDEAAKNAAETRATLGLGDRSAEMVAHVGQRPEGTTPREAAEALGMSNDDAGKYLRRLVSRGTIDSPKRGTYTPVRSVRVSEADTPFGHSDGSDSEPEEES